MDTYLCNKRLLLKQGGDCVAWQINFPLPHTHLISHEALIQPLLSPLASADWLTYGIALFCFSSSSRSPENQTLLPVNLFWFLFGKESSASFFFYTFWSFDRGRTPLNQRIVSIRHKYTGLFSMWTATNKCDNALYWNMPTSGGEYLLLLVIYWGSYKLRLNAGIFNNYSESAQRSFILHWLKAHLQHAFDIRVTQRYHTVHHSSCNRSLRGRLYYRLLLACFNMRENGLIASRPYQ